MQYSASKITMCLRPVWLARTARLPSFSMVELLVVIGIIALLIGLVVTIGSAVVRDGQRRDTQGMLSVLDLAVREFEEAAPWRRVTGTSSSGAVVRYADRYGDYPPDELEPFTANGIPCAPSDVTITLAPTDAALELGGVLLADIEAADVKAMVLAINLNSDKGAEILNRIDARFRKTSETEFVDRNADGNLDPEDVPLTYYVDSWGTPIEYFALNPRSAAVATPGAAGNDRFLASPVFVSKNKGRPLLVSYGPDGPDQFSGDFPPPEALNLVDDHADGGFVDNRFNDDNVYIDDGMAKRLRGN